MSRLRPLAVLVASVITFGLPLALPAAAAQPRWSAAISPAAGDDDTPMDLTASGGCPAPATNVIGRAFGAGLPASGVIVVGNTAAGVRSDTTIRQPLAVTMRDIARDQPQVVNLHGVYRFVLTCRLPDRVASYGDYVAQVRFTSPTSYVALRSPVSTQGPILVDPTATPPAAGGTAPPATASGGVHSPGASTNGAGGTPGDGAPSPAAAVPVQRSSSSAGFALIGFAFLAVLLLLVTAARRRRSSAASER
jgi:hypothetical protein